MAALSQTAAGASGVRCIGAGAFPLSFTDASVWFAHQVNDKSKVLTVLFYLQGSPGWLTGKTDFNWKINQDPATIDMMAGNVPIHAKYWQSTDEIELLGKRYRRSDANVFVIAHIDAPTPVVTGLGVHDLTFKSDDVPSIALLRRNPDVWAALTGHTRGDHPLGKEPAATEEIRSWDKEGLELLESGQPSQERKGCELLRRAAETGYAPAQYRLGYCYESGKGVEQNFSIANKWYAKAGEQGYVDAQYKLGHSYRTGRGTRIDLPTALNWYKKAASSGDRDAMSNVGWMYATGQGTKADQEEAYRWFLDDAKHGDPGGQLEVARRLNEGNGIHKDAVLSYSWLLVLKAQQSNFPPEDWNQINSVITSVEAQLDVAAKKHAGEQALTWMGIIANSDMDAYSHQ
jgi:TPR repeat protein